MAEGIVYGGTPANFPTKPTEEWRYWKMYAIKQIRTRAEYRDMLPRPRLDLSGIPGLSPSAQVPDKPPLAWVACPGILHKS